MVLVRKKKRLFHLYYNSKRYSSVLSTVTTQLKVILILRHSIVWLEGGAGHPGSGFPLGAEAPLSKLLLQAVTTGLCSCFFFFSFLLHNVVNNNESNVNSYVLFML